MKDLSPKKLFAIGISTLSLAAVVMAAVAYTSPDYSDAFGIPAASTIPNSAVLAPLLPGQTGYTIVAASSEASFRAREQLAGHSLPNDAVGKTKSISGAVVLNQDGTVAAEQSKITIGLSTLTSDESRRHVYQAEHPTDFAVPGRRLRLRS